MQPSSAGLGGTYPEGRGSAVGAVDQVGIPMNGAGNCGANPRTRRIVRFETDLRTAGRNRLAMMLANDEVFSIDVYLDRIMSNWQRKMSGRDLYETPRRFIFNAGDVAMWQASEVRARSMRSLIKRPGRMQSHELLLDVSSLNSRAGL